MRRVLLALGLSLAIALPAWAQERVGLLADRISYDRDAATLTAEGRVQIFSEGRVIQTEKLIYDDTTATLTIPGPMTLQDTDGSLFQGTSALIDDQLRQGVIEGARMIVDGQMTLATASIQRREGGITVLSRTVASSCEVCLERPVPIWQFRAARVVHDEAANRIHYDDAIFDLAGVPVFYFPYFSHFDPSVERASGFLTPEFPLSEDWGTAVKLPYFWAIDPTRDATITPYLTSNRGLVVEGEYRQLFDAASLTLDGAAAIDEDILTERMGWFLNASSTIQVTDEIEAIGDIRLVSDRRFLEEYGYSVNDRLQSRITFQSFQDDSYWQARGTYTTTQRVGERQSTVPVVLPDIEHYRIVDRSGPFGGQIAWTNSATVTTRDQGRDSTRITTGLEWEKSEFLGNGLVLTGFAEANVDIYDIRDDAAYPDSPVVRWRPLVGVEARLPLSRVTDNATEIIEPIAQVVVAGKNVRSNAIPNEDSSIVEFDETNLFARSRFPGFDRFETGSRLDYGLKYERIGFDGWTTTATIGQVLRSEPINLLSPGTGLATTQSNFATSLSLTNNRNFRIDTRLLVDDSLVASRFETNTSYAIGDITLSGGFVFLEASGSPDDPVDRGELTLSAGLPLSDNWRGTFATRRNTESGSYIENQINLTYELDCLELLLRGERDFTTSATSGAQTTIGFSFRLLGLTDMAGAGRRGACTPRAGN
ncbi:LPS-assembly protein [Rubricella aquisinus]|uniref:LPS-assembly protein LptD n=1 Tax=Rubricella aquisinus TaxID=2028108 RepID=A0A840WK80_9RHOB|nr:LPS assembly protein LptD [Rubricella aquisinus]MBB5514931.1 LPS-assembly protein [Rubricella aquisinus]